MNGSTLSHWSKDFVEHLRAVHFTLALVSVVLIIAGTNGLDSKLPSALTQIQEIAKFEKQWRAVPSSLYEQASADNKLESKWSTALAVVLPKDFYPQREIDTWLRVPNEEVNRPTTWKFGGRTLPTELSTLADFEDFWNELHKGMTLRLAKEPSYESSCEQFVRVNYSDGTVDLEADSSPLGRELSDFGEPPGICKYGAGLMAAVNGPKFVTNYDLDGDESSVDLRVTLVLPLAKTRFRNNRRIKSLESVSVVGVDTITYKISEKVLARLYFSDWKTGNFRTAFPDLSAASSGIATLEITDAVRRIESETAASQRDISLLGLSIPLAQLSRWGAILLLSVQLYFWLHLHEFANKIEPDADGWDVAWMGLYVSRPAFAVALTSCCLLPVGAAVALGGKILAIEVYYRKTAVAASVLIVVLAALLSFLTARNLRHLRRKVLQESSSGTTGDRTSKDGKTGVPAASAVSAPSELSVVDE